MNLYRILQLHGAPKSSATLIKTYILAKDDEEVFKWIQKNSFHWDNDDYDRKDEWEEMERDILNKKGDLEDDEGWEDAYYGVTKFGWEIVSEGISDNDVEVLQRHQVFHIADK